MSGWLRASPLILTCIRACLACMQARTSFWEVPLASGRFPIDRLATVRSGLDHSLFWRPFKKIGLYGPTSLDYSSVRSFYGLEMETDKKTRLYSPVLLNCSPVRSEKKLDWTVWSSLRLNCSYAYMNIASFWDFRKAHHNNSILYL